MWNKSAILMQVLLTFAAAGFSQTAAPHATGGAASLAELRQAYLDAVQHQRGDQLASLYLWTGVAEDAKKYSVQHFSEPLPAVASAEITNATAASLSDYTRFHVHFNAPVLKMFTITFVPAKDGNGETSRQLYIGQSGGRFYFVTAVPDQDTGQK